MIRVIDEWTTGRGFALRVSRSDWRGRARVDVRMFFEVRPGDPDTRQPTKKGISAVIEDLPRLLAALHKIEADAIREGQLGPEDYENAGLPAPPALRNAA